MQIGHSQPGRALLLAACAVLLAGAGLGAQGEVTLERLRNADSEPENWLVYGGTYRSLRYSGLDQINADNVHTLKAAWAMFVLSRAITAGGAGADDQSAEKQCRQTAHVRFG